MRFLRFVPPLALMWITSCAATAPPPTTEYHVRLDAPQTQMVDLSITVRELSAPTVEFILPTWRPGRYIILDPAATMRRIQAFDDRTSAPLPVRQVRKNAWQVTTSGASDIRVDYRIYANSLADRTRHVDSTHAFLDGASVFLYVPERRNAPASVTINAPENWQVATGLEPLHDDPFVCAAPDYDVLVDSPFEIGLHDTIEFEHDGAVYQIVLWGRCDYDREELIEDFSKIIDQNVAIFGSRPYDRYVFIIHVGRGGGGGTEHLNSTVMQTRRASLEEKGPYKSFLGLVSHEFFHTWNVKQLRPAGIKPYDYEKENYTPLLWVAEGSTSYYSPIILTRAGLKKPDDYLDGLSSSIDSYRRHPARHAQSLEAASFNAWNQFARSTPDDVNSIVSFYSQGSLASLMLDLSLRKATDNTVSYDTVMRTMYERFPLSGPGYTTQDLVRTISELAHQDFTDFFARYIHGTQDMPFEDVVDVVGLELKFIADKHDDNEEEDEDDDEAENDADTQPDSPDPADQDESPIPQKAYLGLNLAGSRVSSVLSDGPAYEQGLIAGDEIIAVDGRRVSSQSALDGQLEDHEPGDEIEITYFRDDQIESMRITLIGVPDASWKLKRIKDPSEAQKLAYESWLGQPWPDESQKKDEHENKDDDQSEESAD